MKVNIQATHDKKFSVEVAENDNVETLKEKIEESQGISPAEMRLIFSGRILKDGDLLSVVKVADGNTIHLVRTSKAVPAKVPSPAVAPPTQQQQQQQQQQPPQARPQQRQPALMPGMQGMPAGMGAMMQNPEMLRQMTDMMATNPQLLQTMLQMNPAYQNASPEVQQLMQRPEFLKMALELAFQQQSTAAPSMEAFDNGGNDEQFMETISAMMGGDGPMPTGSMPMMSPTQTQQQQQPQEPPEVRFQVQLQTLTEMGFFDADENIRALLATGGNVHLAVERLLRDMQ